MRDPVTTFIDTIDMGNVPDSSVILRTAVSVDCVILKFDEGRLCVLLENENNTSSWSIPGRLMEQNENATDAAARLVSHFTVEHNPYLDQVYTFTNVSKDGQPTVSITYVALIRNDDKSNTGKHVSWFSLSDVAALSINQREKIAEAMSVVRRKATFDPVCFNLLPEKFTLPQLRRVFEEIFGENFDQRNFNKKFKMLDILIKLNEKETLHSKKGAFFYKFNYDKYYKMERPGLKFAHLLY